MTHICNKLEKLVPPPLLTISVDNLKSRLIISEWANLAENSHYEVQAELLGVELDCLRGYIERKGTQLRLEKALLLTTQVLKLCQRWKGNDFLTQFKLFESNFVSMEAGCKQLRYPSSQWGNWMIYLALRESAILCKIKLECEHTTKYWLGLIAGSHHFGDSLVVTGILARVWYLASAMVKEFILLAYPKLQSISLLLQQTDSLKWPEEDWKAPENLGNWLRHTLNLPFEPAKLSIDGSNYNTDIPLHFNQSKKTKKNKYDQADEAVLTGKDLFFIDTTGNLEGETETQKTSFESYQCPDEEDHGIIVQTAPTKKTKKRKFKKAAIVKIANQRTETPDPEETDWKIFKKYWNKFFVNTNSEKLKSQKGRKQLLNRLKKYKYGEHVSKRIGLGLATLMKRVKASQDEQMVDVADAFVKFERRVKVETKRMKTKDYVC